MKLVSSLPEFTEGVKLLKRGQWSEAISPLKKAHAESPSPQLSGYIGIAHFYSGDFNSALAAFTPNHPVSAASAALELHFPRPGEMLTAAKSHLISQDPWALAFIQPHTAVDNPFVDSFRNFCINPTLDTFKKIPAPATLQEKSAIAQASLMLAHRLPIAAGQALADAEELGRDGPEGKLLSPWFTCHSLLVHGKRAVNSGQAVLAEALFTAAREQAAAVFNPSRRQICEFRCDKALGELLSKWDKREDRGVQLLESVAGRFDLNLIATASELFLPPPQIQE